MEYRECLLLKHVPERGRVLAHLSHFFKKLMQFVVQILRALKMRGHSFVILTQPVSVRTGEADGKPTN